MFEADPRKRLRVGLFSAGLLILLALSVFMLGRKQGLFVRQVPFQTQFDHVAGLLPGAPVWLDGVVVGSVQQVRLPQDPSEREIEVRFRVDARIARRLRLDSVARLRTVGLLGDRYLELTSGSPGQPELEPGQSIPGVEPTDMAEVLAQSGDVVTNVLAVSASLRRILDRVEHGEGLVGDLIMRPQSGREAMERITGTFTHAEALLGELRQGRGVVGRLLADDDFEQQLVEDFSGAVRSVRRVADELTQDLARQDSLAAGLLRDDQGRERLARVMENLDRAAAAAAQVGEALAQGEGTVPRLISDDEFATTFLEDLHHLVSAFRNIAEKLDGGEGSAARLLNDATLVEDLELVVRGVQESRFLSCLIQSRRRAGEQAVDRDRDRDSETREDTR